MCVAAVCICVSLFGRSSVGDIPSNEVRKQVDRLCRQGEFVSAWHFAIKSWQSADWKYGAEDAYTVELLTIVADVTRKLNKYDLAARLYERALETQEKLLGRDQPEVEQCRAALADLQRSHSE